MSSGAAPAVVLLDLEEGVAAGSVPNPDDRAALCSSVADLVGLAAERSWPCVRVQVELRPEYVDVSPDNAYFATVKKNGRLQAGTWATQPLQELWELLDPMPLIVKRRIGALVGTDLELVLRGLGARGMLLAGLVTRGAVLSTACHAADLDHRVGVVADACLDPDPDVHALLLRDVIPLRASVLTVADLRESGPPWDR